MNNRIKIDDTYFIEIDAYNWILKASVETKEKCVSGQPAKNAGKFHDITLGFYPSLESALKAYADHFEKDEISKAKWPVNTEELETILLGIESACSTLKLAEIDG